ncbi:hypothetical protein MATL_G00118660 [Megalops atlanticus]|uniref:ALMS motif domain-containing protein n=1 Tax=Megalops atlanticus TaxID=7932 RepID=A0A9D3Q1X2_MEGAT|nr:hypothetical protein MATL_G00118660 [Megalops atlanticus]
MKRKVVKVGRLRLSPNEEAQLIREELERRRKLRLQQVREQERYIALQIRKAVQERRDRELQNLTEELQEEWQRQQTEKLQTLERLYQESLKAVGEGHRSAKENEPDWEGISQKAEERQERAVLRHREALKELKLRRQRQEEEQTRHILARKQAMLVEKERAAKVASLPPPPPEPFEKIEAKKLPLVKMSDVDNFSVTHFHMPETAVDHDRDTEQPDARQAAEEETQRLEELGKEEEHERRERLAKAKLRGDCALRKERLNQDRERLLQELARMQQADLLRRRQAVAQMPPQTYQPFYSRQEMREDWQRDLEFAFEDMYAGERRMKGDLVLHLVPEPLPTMTSGSHDDDLNVTLEPDVAPSADEHVDDQQFPSPPPHTQVPAEPAEGASRHALKKLLNKIRTQRSQWSSRTEGETAADGTTIETGSLASEDRGTLVPSVPLHSDHSQPSQGHETTEESIVAGTLLHPKEHAIKISSAEAERRKRQEEELEEQKQEQIALLQQLEEQRRSIELQLQQAQLEKERLQAAVQRDLDQFAQQEVPAQEQEVPPAHAVPPEVVLEQQSPAAEDGDDHSRKVRQYQQRLLDQHRQHKQTVEEARHRLEEYQRALKMRYPSALTAAAGPAVSQDSLHLQAKAAPSTGVPSGPWVPPVPSTAATLFLPQQRPASVLQPRGAVRFPFVHSHAQSSDTSVLSETHSTIPVLDPCPVAPAVFTLPMGREQPPEPTPDLSENGPAPLARVSESATEQLQLPSVLLPAHSAALVNPAAVAPQPSGPEPKGLPGRASPASPGSPTPKPSPRESPPPPRGEAAPSLSVAELEAQRRELQEAQLRLEAQRKAFLDQQRAQERALLQQQSQLREQMRRQREALDTLLSEAQPPQSRPLERGVSRTEQLCLMSTLLKAIEESNGSLASSQSTDLLPHSSVPPNQNQADSLSHVSLSSDTGSQSEPRSRAPPQPRAAKPPLARPRLGLLEMIEQHELSAIQEVETPINASLTAAGEEPEASSTLMEEADESDSSSCVERGPSSASRGSSSGSGSGSGCSGRLSWRERLLLESGSSPEADPARASALTLHSSVMAKPHEEQGAVPLQCSEERYPPPSVQAPVDPECLSSTTISTGSFSTNEPDFSSTAVDSSLPVDTERGGGALASLCRHSIRDDSSHLSPTSESISHRSMIQSIIDKYTRELNVSLEAVGSFAALSAERDVSGVGGESSISPPGLKDWVNCVEGRSLVPEPDLSSLYSGQSFGIQTSSQEASIPKLYDGSSSLYLQDTHGELGSRRLLEAMEDVSTFSFEGPQNSSGHFLPLEPRPDFNSSTSSSQRSERQEQIRRAEEWDSVSQITGHTSGQSSSVCQAEWRDSTASRLIGHFSDQSTSHWLNEGQDSAMSQSVGLLSDDPSSQLLGGGRQITGESEDISVDQRSESSGGGTGHSLPRREHGGPARVGQSEEPAASPALCLMSTGPSNPELDTQEPEPPSLTQDSLRNVPDVLFDSSRELQETGMFQEISPEYTQALQDPAEGEGTLVDPTSDSFHPLLAEVTQNETAEHSMTFHLPEQELHCSGVAGEGGAPTCETERPPSPEQLRAEQQDLSLHPPAPLQDSLCQLAESQSTTQDSVLTESLVTEDPLLTARRLPVLSLPDLAPLPMPEEGACSDTGPAPREGDEALMQRELGTRKPDTSAADGTGSYRSKDSLPAWERILELGSGGGILEEPELTLMNLTESTVQELSVDEEEEEARGKSREPLSENFKSLSLEDTRNTKEESVQSHAVMLLEFQSSPGDLQQAFLQRRQDFIQRSARRLEEMRSRRAETGSPHVNWPKSTMQSHHSHRKSQLQPPVGGSELKKVGEVRVCTPEHRKMEEAEMHQRTERLYNQLEEVRKRKEMKLRQESYAKNREKAKEFQKKTLQKLRAKQARR